MTTYYIPRQAPPPAVPPPEALGPQTTQPDLDRPPPRPPFTRYANRYPYEARRDGWVVDPWKGNAKEHRRLAGRASLEGAYLYRGLWRSGVAARVVQQHEREERRGFGGLRQEFAHQAGHAHGFAAQLAAHEVVAAAGGRNVIEAIG